MRIGIEAEGRIRRESGFELGCCIRMEWAGVGGRGGLGDAGSAKVFAAAGHRTGLFASERVLHGDTDGRFLYLKFKTSQLHMRSSAARPVCCPPLPASGFDHGGGPGGPFCQGGARLVSERDYVSIPVRIPISLCVCEKCPRGENYRAAETATFTVVPRGALIKVAALPLLETCAGDRGHHSHMCSQPSFQGCRVLPRSQGV